MQPHPWTYQLSSSLFSMHHQCVAPLAANSPHSGLSRAISIASSKVRLCRDRSFFRVAVQEEWGRPTGLLQSLWGAAVRILLASADNRLTTNCSRSILLLLTGQSLLCWTSVQALYPLMLRAGSIKQQSTLASLC